jgi:hypothetical protein
VGNGGKKMAATAKPKKIQVHASLKEGNAQEEQAVRISVTPKRLDAWKKDELHWQVANPKDVGTYEISFDKGQGSPLEWKKKSESGGENIEGTIKEDVTDNTVHGYSVRVTFKSGTSGELDPEIRIRPPSR